MKRAAAVPVYKSGDKVIPGNYRPISLTSCISKVFERFIRKQVVAFLDRRGFLNDSQHGFRSDLSCLSALFIVLDNLMNMINSKSTVDMIYLDFSKAFDRVHHGIVLHKLRDFRISGNLGACFLTVFNSSGCLTGSWSVWSHAVTPHSTIYHLVFVI